ISIACAVCTDQEENENSKWKEIEDQDDSICGPGPKVSLPFASRTLLRTLVQSRSNVASQHGTLFADCEALSHPPLGCVTGRVLGRVWGSDFGLGLGYGWIEPNLSRVTK